MIFHRRSGGRDATARPSAPTRRLGAQRLGFLMNWASSSTSVPQWIGVGLDVLLQQPVAAHDHRKGPRRRLGGSAGLAVAPLLTRGSSGALAPGPVYSSTRGAVRTPCLPAASWCHRSGTTTSAGTGLYRVRHERQDVSVFSRPMSSARHAPGPAHSCRIAQRDLTSWYCAAPPSAPEAG